MGATSAVMGIVLVETSAEQSNDLKSIRIDRYDNKYRNVDTYTYKLETTEEIEKFKKEFNERYGEDIVKGLTFVTAGEEEEVLEKFITSQGAKAEASLLSSLISNYGETSNMSRTIGLALTYNKKPITYARRALSIDELAILIGIEDIKEDRTPDEEISLRLSILQYYMEQIRYKGRIELLKVPTKKELITRLVKERKEDVKWAREVLDTYISKIADEEIKEVLEIEEDKLKEMSREEKEAVVRSNLYKFKANKEELEAKRIIGIEQR